MGLQLIDYRPGPYTDHGPATLTSGDTHPTLWLTINADGHFELNGERYNICADHLIETANGLDTNAEVDGLCNHIAAAGINMVRMLGWNNKPKSGGTPISAGCFKMWPWRAGTVVATKEQVVASGNVYQQVSGTTCGSTIPSHTSGTVSDGGVSWAYVSTAVAAGLNTTNDYYDTTFLAQMDRTVADLNSRGIRIWFCFDHGDKPRMVENLAPNTANGSSDSRRSDGDHGMMWSDTWNDMYERHISYMLSRTNTVTGVAYKDNPMVSVVQAFNENTMWDACTKRNFPSPYTSYSGMDFIVNEVGGTGSGAQGGSGWWRTELDAHWNAWAAAQSPVVTWPQARFPTYSQWTGGGVWTNALVENMIDYIKDVDKDAAIRYRTFIKALMPNVVYCYVENRYADVRVGIEQDVGSIHFYESEGTTAGSDSPTRKSSLDDGDGLAGLLTSGGAYSPRITDQPYVFTEGPGQYSRNRNDFDNEPVRATINCLQDVDGMTQFCAWQSSFYSSASGSASSGFAHYTNIWPSRRLSYLFAVPIFKHRLIAPITTETAFVVNPDEVASRVRADGLNIRQTGQEVAGTGSEWSWMRRQLSTTYSGTTNVTTDTTINDAAVQAGVNIDTASGRTTFVGAGAANPRLTWDHAGVLGICSHIDNGTFGGGTNGTLTISGLSAPFRGMCAMRSNGDYAMNEGDCVFFLHGATFQTNMTVSGISTYPGNFNAWMAGDQLVISGGTDANTRLVVPDPVTVVLDLNQEYLVYGLTASGLATAVTGTLIPSTWDAGAGTVTFTTDSDYPAYYLEHVPTTVVTTITTIRGRGMKRRVFNLLM